MIVERQKNFGQSSQSSTSLAEIVTSDEDHEHISSHDGGYDTDDDSWRDKYPLESRRKNRESDFQKSDEIIDSIEPMPDLPRESEDLTEDMEENEEERAKALQIASSKFYVLITTHLFRIYCNGNQRSLHQVCRWPKTPIVRGVEVSRRSCGCSVASAAT